MKADQRQQQILRILREKGNATAAFLSKLLGVSEVTIRRDFDVLESNGSIRRMFGGVILNETNGYGNSGKLFFDERTSVNEEKKRLIGLCASKLVHERDAIYLDIGTTIAALAVELRERANIIALTNSLAVLNILSDSSVKLYSIGGCVNGSEHSINGDVANSFVRAFNIDNAFIGAAGVTLENGISEYFNETARLRKAVIERAKKVTLLADSGKFGIDRFSVVCPLDNVNTIITDSGLPAAYAERICEMGIELIFADK